MDYSTLSNEELLALSNNDYSKLSNETLLKLSENQAQPEQKGIDLTPSGLAKQDMIRKKAMIEAPFRALKNKQSISQSFKNIVNEENTKLQASKPSPVADFALDMTAYGGLPLLKGTNGLAKTGAFGGNALLQGGLPMGLEALKQGENALGGTAIGTTIGAGLQGLPYVGNVARAIPLVKGTVDLGKRVGKNALQGALESFAMGKDAVGRMIKSPRGSELSRKADYYGSDEFVNDIANRFKSGVDALRNQETKAFSEARDNLLANNQDSKVNLQDFVDDTYQKLFDMGYIDKAGNLTPVGKRAEGINQLMDDLNYYRGEFDLNELQRLKANVLDDVINYKPNAGQTLNNSTRGLQNIARGARKDINDMLNNALGEEYGAINNKLSNVLNTLDNTPELKDLTNAQNIDSLAGKLKKVGTTRQQAQQEINKLESIMNDNGINVSENGLINDILDYNAAKDINQRIRTGQDANFRNIPRRALVQPLTEFYVDRVVPFQNGLRSIQNGLKPIMQRGLTPFVSRGLSPMLYGGITYDEEY